MPSLTSADNLSYLYIIYPQVQPDTLISNIHLRTYQVSNNYIAVSTSNNNRSHNLENKNFNITASPHSRLRLYTGAE